MSTIKELAKRFTEQIQHVDDISQIVLKGHLVIEETMTEAIGRFVFHKDIIESANLRFPQKLALCRAMTISEHESNMWDVISAINTLRNYLSHSLNIEKRSQKINSLKSVFGKESNCDIKQEKEEDQICMAAISYSLGFLHAFLEDVKRFELMVNTMDLIMNTAKKET